MSKPTSLLGSFRAYTALPKQPPQGLTKAQVIFTPGGSQVIKDNLKRVFEYKEHRIYGSYLTGVTAVRSAFEIVPTVGKLLLNTATWFVDLTSTRSEGYAIIKEGFFDVIHSIKTTIALPFFSIAGLIFPADVFGLFENVPEVQTKAEIIKEESQLAKLKANKSRTEADLHEARTELLELEGKLDTTEEAIAKAEADLTRLKNDITKSAEIAADAEKLKTEVLELKSTIAQLQGDELVATSRLKGISEAIAKQENLDNTQTALLEAQEELLERQNELDETEEALILARDELAVVNEAIANTEENGAAAENLKAEVLKLEDAIAELKRTENSTTLNLNAIREELVRLGAQKEESASRNEELRASFERERSAKQAELERIQATLKETTEKETTAQSKLESLNEEASKLASKNQALRTEVEKLEKIKLELTEQEQKLRTQIESQKCELVSLDERLNEAKTSMLLELQNLKQQIDEKASTLSEHNNELSRLGRENIILEEKRTALAEQVRKLEFTTLKGLNTRHDALSIEVDELDQQKGILSSEIAAKKEALLTETQSIKHLEDQIRELKKNLVELERQEANLTNKVLPELEERNSKFKQRKSTLISEISAERKKFQDAQAQNEETQRQLEITMRSLESMRQEEARLKEMLESIQKVIRESSEATEGAQANAEQAILTFQEKLQTLGISISELTDKDAELKLSLDEKDRILKAKTADFERLSAESAEFEKKIQDLITADSELTSKVKTLRLDIEQLESKEAALKKQQSELQENVQSLTANVEKLSTQSRELEVQVRTATEQKNAAEKDLENLTHDINSAKRLQSKIQSDIEGLQLNIKTLEATLVWKQKEDQRLEEQIPKLTLEEKTLATKIAYAEQLLSKLSETQKQVQEAQESKMKSLKEAESNLAEEIALLESEKKVKISDFEKLQKEFSSLTSSTQSLREQEEVLKETVGKTELANQTATKRLATEEKACIEMQNQTRKAADQIETYNQQISGFAEKKQKLEVEFETRRQQLEEDLRKREQEAVSALELKLKEQRMQSPSRAKIQSPVRTGILSTPSDPLFKDVLEAEAKFGLLNKAVEKKQQALKENQEALDAIKKETDAYKTQLQNDLDRINKEMATVREERNRYRKEASAAQKDRDRYVAEIKLVKKISATPIKSNNVTNGQTDTNDTDK